MSQSEDQTGQSEDQTREAGVLYLVVCSRHGSRYLDLAGPEEMCPDCRVQSDSQLSAEPARTVYESEIVDQPVSGFAVPADYELYRKLGGQYRRMGSDMIRKYRMCCLSYPGELHALTCLTRRAATSTYQDTVAKAEGRVGIMYGLSNQSLTPVEMEEYLSAIRETVDRCVGDSDDPMATAIGVVIGAASMCWTNPGGAGVFDAERAEGLIRILRTWIMEQSGTADAKNVGEKTDG